MLWPFLSLFIMRLSLVKFFWCAYTFQTAEGGKKEEPKGKGHRTALCAAPISREYEIRILSSSGSLPWSCQEKAAAFNDHRPLCSIECDSMKQEFKLSLHGELSADWDVAQWEENVPKGLWFYWESRSKTWFQVSECTSI